MDYSDFDVEDFASDEFFILWIFGNSAEASVFWERYKRDHPEAVEKIDKARALLLNIQKAEETYYSTEEIEMGWSQIQRRIARPSSQRKSFLLRIAAVISVISLVTLVFYLSFKGYFSASNRSLQAVESHDLLIKQVNDTGATIKIYLSDGSVVSLGHNSQLRYASDYTNRRHRVVYLTGEALFDIAKNPQQPFLVYANEVVTKVLGTSFHVKAFDDDSNITVSVLSGKVSVYSDPNRASKRDAVRSEVNGVVLLPNQQALYKRGEESFSKTLIETPQVINRSALQSIFQFDNEPIKNVFEVLEDAYGVDLIFDEEVVQNCYLTVPLGDEPLFEKLRIICRTIGAQYEQMDGKIIISSKGCVDVVHD